MSSGFNLIAARQLLTAYDRCMTVHNAFAYLARAFISLGRLLNGLSVSNLPAPDALHSDGKNDVQTPFAHATI